MITWIAKKILNLSEINVNPNSLINIARRNQDNAQRKFLNKILCGFRKAHSTQHALFRVLQAWQKGLDNW